MKIGELARRAGLQPSALRFYERVGLIPRAPRVSGRREYAVDALDRLYLIQAGQRAGFTLKEILVLVSEAASGRRLSARWRELAQRKLSELDELVARATAMRALLKEGLRCGCVSPRDCALVAQVMAQPGPTQRRRAGLDRLSLR